MTLSNFEKIKEFHATFSRTPDPTSLDLRTPEDRLLRAKLIFEEVMEVFAELGVVIGVDMQPQEDGTVMLDFEPVINEDHLEINPRNLAKELADLKYVTYGTDASFGIDADRVYAEVHDSNMSKLGPNGEVLRRDDGKVLKGPNYREPSLSFLPESI